jgi:flagellar biosynthetic protein FlhB
MPDDQTEKATPRRRQKAREEGQVVRSRELTGALVLLTGTLFVGWFSSGFISQWRSALFSLLEEARTSDLSLQAGNQGYWLLRSLLSRTMLPVLFFMGSLFCIAALVNVAQTGGIAVRSNAFQLNFSRLSPSSYFSQVFSRHSPPSQDADSIDGFGGDRSPPIGLGVRCNARAFINADSADV